MTSEYLDYKVEIINKEFTTSDGITYPQTAIITFFDQNDKATNTLELGHLNTIEIYNLIDKKEFLNLDFCYIKNFSITAYRRTRIIDKVGYVHLPGFSAKNSFFDSNFQIDFSYIEFGEKDLIFSNSYFANGKLTFNHSKFNNGLVDFSYSFFYNGDVDFSNTVFGDGDISFKNAIFKQGIKDFQYADFGTGTKTFINTDFGEGSVSFINTNFNNGRVSFKVARFGKGKVDFHFAKFGNGDISFEQTEFGDGKIDFRTVEFNAGKVNFNRAEFGTGEVSFEASQATKGKISFKRTNFGHGDLNFELAEYESSEMIFDKAIFGDGNVSFYNAKCKQLSFKSCHLNNYLDVRLYKCEYIYLSDTIVRDIIDFKPYDFDVDIDVVDFSGMRLIGRIYIDWKTNNVKQLINSQPKSSHRVKSEQFRILKENFSVTGQYSDEDKSYIEFKRHEMKADLQDEIEKNIFSSLWEYPWYYLKLIIFDKAGQYATNPLRVMLSMVVTFIIFSLIYTVILLINNTGIVSGIGGEHDQLSLIGRSFYHSAITFLTIGYGDFYPFGPIRWLSGIEGFVGLFLMSYFTVAFVRKILR